MRNRLQRWINLGIVALVLAGCTAGAGGRPGAEGTGGGSGQMVDANSNKIFDNLESIMSRAKQDEKIPVLIMTKGPEAVLEVEKAAGSLVVTHRYQVVPALAANVTTEQVKDLARLEAVRHIEHDAEVRIAMDGANRWFGSAQARSDYGVDGNRDGSAGYGKNDVVVAIIDTGIDASHVDLDGGKVIAWQDWVNNRPAAYDDHGHGTHVASITAGTGEGNASYVGVAPGAALIGLKVLNSAGSGSLSNVAAAVDWAVANRETYNIKVISTSEIKVTQREEAVASSLPFTSPPRARPGAG